MKLCTDLVVHGFQKCMFDDKKEGSWLSWIDSKGLFVNLKLVYRLGSIWSWILKPHNGLFPPKKECSSHGHDDEMETYHVSSNYHSYLWNSQTVCQYLIQLEWNKMVRRCSSHVIWQGCGGKKACKNNLPAQTYTHTSWRGFKGHFLLQLEMCHAFSKQAKEEMKQHFDESCLAKTRWEKQFKEKTFGPQVTKSKRKERRTCKYALNVIWCAIQWICRQIWDLISKCLYTTYETYMCHVTI